MPDAIDPTPAMVRYSAIWCVGSVVVSSVLALVWRGGDGALSAAIGGVIVLATLAGSLLLVNRLVTSMPEMAVAVSVGVFLVVVTLVGSVAIAVGEHLALDGAAFTLGALVATAVWQGAHVRALCRARVPVFQPHVVEEES